MSRLLILGGLGMLGHRLAMDLSGNHTVTVTVRDTAGKMPVDGGEFEILEGIDLRNSESLQDLLRESRWDVIVNAAGVIKHRLTPESTADAVLVNAWLPRELAALANTAEMRLIHFSTDCVFSGDADSTRGPGGYRTTDPADARDVYGLSKLLGEPVAPGCLCLRTSLIGPELRGHFGLLGWYVNTTAARVPGFTRALFNGITTGEAARLVDFLVCEHPDLDGLWHVGAEPISKFELLSQVRLCLGKGAEVIAEDGPFCDRRLDPSEFQARTGWEAPSWQQMISDIVW